MANNSTIRHVAVMAFPFGTHAVPLLTLAQRLSSEDPTILFSFLSTPSNLLTLKIPEKFLAFEIAEEKPSGEFNVPMAMKSFSDTAKDKFKAAIEKAEKERGVKVSCLLTDAFLWFCDEVAAEMGVAWVPYWTSGASALSLHLNTDLIRNTLGENAYVRITSNINLSFHIDNFVLKKVYQPDTKISGKMAHNSTIRHVAVMAFPFGTHAMVLLSLAQRLSSEGPSILFSFLSTPSSLSSLKIPEKIVPFEIVEEKPSDEFDVLMAMKDFSYTAKDKFKVGIERAEKERGVKVSCLLTDAFLWFCDEVAVELGVAWVPYWTSGASALSTHVNTDLIRDTLGDNG